ncbi:Uncharacterized protein APZ42_029071 [Daphnia magna]|uniref:Uncharacterized protein n=1 Tax=Daphnia magna TaxID=35525 RepID=A0A164PY79_9CRUS|nr:Uncharacterized protein APZ42_029071 [Daphnia magna]
MKHLDELNDSKQSRNKTEGEMLTFNWWAVDRAQLARASPFFSKSSQLIELFLDF